MALDVLVVDDEADIRELVSGVLEDEGYSVRTAADSTRCARRDRGTAPVAACCSTSGCRARASTGCRLLEEVKRRDPKLPVLMISGHGNLDTAVAAIREGAIDFIEKPFEAERLVHLVARATETDRLRRENEDLRQQVGHDDQLTGTSVAINNVRATLKRVAPTGSRVLITGPAGVGKEIAARMIHQWSPRAKAPFIVVSAAMMSPERVEEELFGSESDGVARPGLLEQAHGGTLFLDEIADMPLTTQAKILRVLTDQSFHRDRRPAADQGRRAGGFGDVAQPCRGDRRGPVPRGPLLPAQRRAGAPPGRCASGARTFPSSSTISSPASPPSGGIPTPRILR